MTVVSLFILFISTNCLGQVKDILFTHWERTDYDSLGKHIQENKSIFDVDVFNISNTSDTIMYWPYGSCLSPQSYATCKINFKDSTIHINYYRNYYDSISKAWDKKYFSEPYKFLLSISPPKIADKEHIFSSVKGAEKIREVEFKLTLRSLTNNQISMYHSYDFVHDRAFLKYRRAYLKYRKTFIPYTKKGNADPKTK
jgi:hypothetical protein